MAIGPVQLLVLGFDQPEFKGEVLSAVEQLRTSDIVRVIDSLVVYRRPDGTFQAERLSNLSSDEATELGSKIGALIGFGSKGDFGIAPGAAAGADAASGGIQVFTDDYVRDLLAEIPLNAAGALILLEHHWAVPLRDAVVSAGGFLIRESFITPLDLVAVGLATDDEISELEALRMAPAATNGSPAH